MKNKQLQKRIDKFVKEANFENTNGAIKGSIYFTENPINYNDNYYGQRYFFCYHNTHTIVTSFKTQDELGEYLLDFGY